MTRAASPRLFYADGGRVAAARAHGRTAEVVSSNVRVRFELTSDASESAVRFSSYNKNPRFTAVRHDGLFSSCVA